MTQRASFILFLLSVCATGTGCTLLPTRGWEDAIFHTEPASNKQQVHTTGLPSQDATLQMVNLSTGAAERINQELPGSPYNQDSQEYLPQVPDRTDDRKSFALSESDVEFQKQKFPIIEHQPEFNPPEVPTEPVGLFTSEVVELVKHTPEQDCLVRALDELLKQHPEQALQLLDEYSPSRREVLMRLMAAMDQLHTDKEAQLDPEGVKILSDQLSGILIALRPRAKLVIDRMCLCRCVKSFGSFTPMAPTHVYRSGTSSIPGEKVQVYVQLRNLCSDKRNDGYHTILSSKARIRNTSTGEEVWFKDFGDHRKPFYSQTIRHDHFVNYSFPVPIIPAGQYTLEIEVSDVTRPDSVRTAQESVELRVGS